MAPQQYSTISADSLAIVEAIRAMQTTLSERVAKTENDFVQALHKVEVRLDQLVDLTKSVAVLQAQSNTHADDFSEFKTSIKEDSKAVHARISGVKEAHDDLDREVRAWYNYGRALWAVFVAVSSFAGWMLNRSIDAVAAEKQALSAKIEKLQQAADANDVRLSQVIIKLQEKR